MLHRILEAVGLASCSPRLSRGVIENASKIKYYDAQRPLNLQDGRGCFCEKQESLLILYRRRSARLVELLVCSSLDMANDVLRELGDRKGEQVSDASYFSS